MVDGSIVLDKALKDTQTREEEKVRLDIILDRL